MKKIDARKLPSEVQEEKRKQAIRLHKNGKRYKDKEIAELVEVHFETIGKWVRAYGVNGMEALSSNVRGRRRGSSRKLTPEHEDIIQGLIIDNTRSIKNGVCIMDTQSGAGAYLRISLALSYQYARLAIICVHGA